MDTIPEVPFTREFVNLVTHAIRDVLKAHLPDIALSVDDDDRPAPTPELKAQCVSMAYGELNAIAIIAAQLVYEMGPKALQYFAEAFTGCLSSYPDGPLVHLQVHEVDHTPPDPATALKRMRPRNKFDIN